MQTCGLAVHSPAEGKKLPPPPPRSAKAKRSLLSSVWGKSLPRYKRCQNPEMLELCRKAGRVCSLERMKGELSQSFRAAENTHPGKTFPDSPSTPRGFAFIRLPRNCKPFFAPTCLFLSPTLNLFPLFESSSFECMTLE